MSTSEDRTEQRFPEFVAGGRSRCRFADAWEREVAAAGVVADRGTGVDADSCVCTAVTSGGNSLSIFTPGEDLIGVLSRPL